MVGAGSLRMGMLVIYAVLTFLWGELARGVEGENKRRNYVQSGGRMLYNFMTRDAAPKSGVSIRESFGGVMSRGYLRLVPKATRQQRERLLRRSVDENRSLKCTANLRLRCLDAQLHYYSSHTAMYIAYERPLAILDHLHLAGKHFLQNPLSPLRQ